jgi:hypothetical protein
MAVVAGKTTATGKERLRELREIQARCTDILQSPYIYRELPPELARLRMFVQTVQTLVAHDVPGLLEDARELQKLRQQHEPVPIVPAATPTNGTEPVPAPPNGTENPA